MSNNIYDEKPSSQFVPGEAVDLPNVSSDPTSKGARNRKESRLAAEEAWVREKFDLPDSEQLIASFSAALLRHILLQGRLYITTSAICFYARIFGKVTKECISFVNIAHVKKRRGGFVANAIKIYFPDDTVPPVIFASLNHREKAFNMIQDRLHELNPAAEKKDDDDGSCASAGNDREDSDERSADEHDPFNENGVHCTQNGNPAPVSSNHHLENFSRNTCMDKRVTDTKPLENINDEDSPECKLVWRTPDDIVGRVSAYSFDKKDERARGVLDAPVREVFNLLYISDWLKEYHEAVNNREVYIADWRRGDDGSVTREVNFRRPLGYKLGPKETRVREIQRYFFTESDGVVVEIQGENLDVPYGSYFIVESFFEMEPLNEGLQTQLVASVSVHFLKSTMLQGKIESGALDETKKAFQRLIELAGQRVREYNAEKNHSDYENGRTIRHGTNTAKPASTSHCNRVHFEADEPGQMRSRASVINSSGVKQRVSNSSEPVNGDKIDSVNVLANSEKMDEKQSQKGSHKRMDEPSISKVHYSEHTHWMRIATLTMLAFVCVLLLTVLMVLRRVHHSVNALEEKIIHQQSLTSGGDVRQCSPL